jgi:hypothetical protein
MREPFTRQILPRSTVIQKTRHYVEYITPTGFTVYNSSTLKTSKEYIVGYVS